MSCGIPRDVRNASSAASLPLSYQVSFAPAPRRYPRPRAADADLRVRGNVATEGEHAGRRPPAEQRGAVRHRHALREPNEDDHARLAAASCVDGPVHVGDVVGDRDVPVLQRHPARHHGLIAAGIEAMQPLDGCHTPLLPHARNAKGVLQHDLGALPVAVKSDEQPIGPGSGGVFHEHTAVRDRFDQMRRHFPSISRRRAC